MAPRSPDHRRAALDGDDINCYVSTHPTNSYDLGGFRIRYQIEDHLIPE